MKQTGHRKTVSHDLTHGCNLKSPHNSSTGCGGWEGEEEERRIGEYELPTGSRWLTLNLYSSGSLQICSPASAFQVPELQTCAIMPGSFVYFYICMYQFLEIK